MYVYIYRELEHLNSEIYKNGTGPAVINTLTQEIKNINMTIKNKFQKIKDSLFKLA